MRLSEFIVSHMESILAEFEDFAKTHTAAGPDMDMTALRDHAAAILTAIALDLEQPQSDAQQAAKATGDAPEAKDPTAAAQHGTDRADSGFTLDEMFSEYRALRASVLRLWSAERGGLDGADLDDLIRFNEAIDQALAESISRYSTSLDHSREMFLAVLGHDLRNPLSAIVTASGFLESKAAEGGSDRRMAATIRQSGERMNRLVGDLLDFTLSRLGRGIPVERANVDVADVARQALDEAEAMHPDRTFQLDTAGDVKGEWDGDRIGQALGNLVGNAVQHGDASGPIVVRTAGFDGGVDISVHNEGEALPKDARRHIFDPFKRLSPKGDRRSMGLGLYITEQIVSAHGGSIDVESSPSEGTTFTIHLPRTQESGSAAAPGVEGDRRTR